MRRGLSFCALILGIGCMMLAGHIYLQNQQGEVIALSASQSIVEAFDQSIQSQTTDVYSYVVQTAWTERTTTPTVEVDGTAYMGLISIPTLDLLLPIADGWSDAKLLYTPCAYAGTLVEDNLIIAAHNYSAHFGAIHQMTLGDTITIQDATGALYSYALIAQEGIGESDLEGLYSGSWDVTLFTCLYGDNTQRVVLRFEAVEDQAG